MRTLNKKELPTFVPDSCYTIEQWLAIEEVTGEKYEYHDGKLVSWRAMAGGTWQHALIASNLAGIVFRDYAERTAQFKDCHAYTSDLRIAISNEKRYVYPDTAIICGKPVFDKRVPTAVVNPRVIFEVISSSSEQFDAGEKFDYYEQLDTLRDYVLVGQKSKRVEVRTRASATSPWRVFVYLDSDGAFTLPSLGDAAFHFEDVYRGWEMVAKP